MGTTYYSCKEREDLVEAFSSIKDLTNEKGYSDWDITIDIIGKIDTSEYVYNENGELDTTVTQPEPNYTDFLFNIIFITDKYRELFNGFKEEEPKTPIRKFL